MKNQNEEKENIQIRKIAQIVCQKLEMNKENIIEANIIICSFVKTGKR